eukprot:scaffold19766_cov122-Isochrysis_galbana.AAC.2
MGNTGGVPPAEWAGLSRGSCIGEGEQDARIRAVRPAAAAHLALVPLLVVSPRRPRDDAKPKEEEAQAHPHPLALALLGPGACLTRRRAGTKVHVPREGVVARA